LERMGHFQLAMACEQAATQGIQAQAVVRHGHLQAELIAAAHELRAEFIVLGRPREGASVFDDEALHSFARHLRAETGAEVRVL
jgi:hypothetical protein